MAKFARTVGHWEGSGQVWSEPGGEPGDWTASETVEWVLDGYFAQTDLEVRLPDLPLPMTMRGIYGWDAQGERWVSYASSNMGETSLDEAFWIGDTLLINKASIENGEPMVQRVAMTYGEDSYAMTIERAIGLGDFHVHAQGTFEKVETPSSPPTVPTSAPILPTPKSMTKLAGMVGDWKMAGTMRPMAGMPEMPVQATESVRSLWGGSCIMNEVVGEPSPMGQYRGLGFFTWNARAQTYVHTWFDNMGGVQTSEGRFQGRDLVFQYAGPEYGVPVSMRSRMTFDEAGKMASFSVDRMASGGDPERSFDVAYTAAN